MKQFRLGYTIIVYRESGGVRRVVGHLWNRVQMPPLHSLVVCDDKPTVFGQVLSGISRKQGNYREITIN
ncbi:MAG TPA: hypothetical protein VEA59_05885 [Patescibacteria group bacterium]|nr:hypothetical protein [Patescibacteria group bacterium]